MVWIWTHLGLNVTALRFESRDGNGYEWDAPWYELPKKRHSAFALWTFSSKVWIRMRLLLRTTEESNRVSNQMQMAQIHENKVHWLKISTNESCFICFPWIDTQNPYHNNRRTPYIRVWSLLLPKLWSGDSLFLVTRTRLYTLLCVSIGPFSFLAFFSLRPHCSCPNAMVTSISALTHPRGLG